jgi:hypothetical protein
VRSDDIARACPRIAELARSRFVADEVEVRGFRELRHPDAPEGS